MAVGMAGRTSPQEPDASAHDTSVGRLPLPRWIIAVLVLIGAILLLWRAFGILILQATIQGLVVGSIYVLGASGLSLTYGIKKFANFAHGDMMTVGAYAAFTLNVILAQHILLGFVFAIFAVALLGVFLELSIFRRLEGRGPVSALIASVGVSFVLLYIFAAVIIGGIGSPYGAMIGGLIIGIVQKLSNVVFGALQGRFLEGGAEYEPVGAFLVMIIVLLFLPEGIMGIRRHAMGGRVAALLARWRRLGVREPG